MAKNQKTKENRVAGRIEPARERIHTRMFRRFVELAKKAWGIGIHYYLHMLSPFWRTIVKFSHNGFRGIAWLCSRIARTCKGWIRRNQSIGKWTLARSRGTHNWISNEKQDIRSGFRDPYNWQPEYLGQTNRSILVWYLAYIMAITGSILLIIKTFSPVSQAVGIFWTIIFILLFLLIMFFITGLLGGILVIHIFYLIIPILTVIGICVITAVSLCSLVILLLLVSILLVSVPIGIACLSVLLSVIAILASVLFIPIIIGTFGFAVYLFSLLVLQCLLLLIIVLLRPGQYLWVFSRGLRYVCPSGNCGSHFSAMKVPVHICNKCGSAYTNLWPSSYGVLYHICEGNDNKCKQKLPTMDFLGRNQLIRVCRNCGTEFVSRSSFKLTTNTVAVIGGKSVGKTSMILMMAHELLDYSDTKQYRAEIDTPEQRMYYEREWKLLSSGRTVAPTSGSVPDAFILRLSIKGNKSLLYLYDSAGEQFTRISSLSQHAYLQKICGIIILVDPLSLPRYSLADGNDLDNQPGSMRSIVPFKEIVEPLLNISNRFYSENPNLPVAIVITKADIPLVKNILGDILAGKIAGDKCRNALCAWGAGTELMSIEAKFKNVNYFACSALGRIPDMENKAPFSAYGVLDPLFYVLPKEKKANRLP
jgi:hypothetical protein